MFIFEPFSKNIYESTSSLSQHYKHVHDYIEWPQDNISKTWLIPTTLTKDFKQYRGREKKENKPVSMCTGASEKRASSGRF